MRKVFCLLLLLCLFACAPAWAGIFGRVHGVVHDPQHRPIAGAHVVLKASHSSFTSSVTTTQDGAFQLNNIPVGDYEVTVTQAGFDAVRQTLTLESDTTPTLHFELQIGSITQAVTVTNPEQVANVDSVTTTTLVDRQAIANTPGADRTNSMAMITDYVPGAYMTHDMLHMRGGHQVSWLLDGVQIPNTNISSNLAAQIDPKDIDYLEVQRGSYTADEGDRTYGIFNVVPRSGFERDRGAELVLSAGSFLQTNDALSLGDHSKAFAWYTSLSGNRSDYGLSPPVGKALHDVANGAGGFLSLIYNKSSKDQLRLFGQLRTDFFQIPYDPDPHSIGNSQIDSSGLRDTQRENDGTVAFTWLRTLNATSVIQVSPFIHVNTANYHSNPTEQPVATTDDRTSRYGGTQFTGTTQIAHNTLQAGIYFFEQFDDYRFGAIFNDGSGTAPINEADAINGSVDEEYVSDTFKATSWLTLNAGIRLSRFNGQIEEQVAAPRFGAAVRIPKLNWVFRGYYGRFYQPPPLLTASGPILAYADSNNITLVPLRGERDEEHQFGVQIPLHGWLIDIDNSKNRVNTFLDHSNIGASSIYFPVTVDGALVRAWEISVRSPRAWRFGQAHLAYSNQIAEQRGAITGGLICTPIGSPQCDGGFVYRPVDHDQRNTLNVGFNAALPRHTYASTNIYYGSGFTNGGYDPTGGPPADPKYPGQYLPSHTTVDLAIGKSFGVNITASVTATNVSNTRVLLDTSLTFGGFHFNDPRQIYGEVKYRFHF